MNEIIEAAFSDEYARLKHDGFEKLVGKSLDELFYVVYRHGYIRGHADRSREVQRDEEQARREGRYPMNVEIKYDGDRLILDGKDRTPSREDDPWLTRDGKDRTPPRVVGEGDR